METPDLKVIVESGRETMPHPSFKAKDAQGKRLMDLSLSRAAEKAKVDDFIKVLDEVANVERLTRSAVLEMVSPIGSTCCHIAAEFGNIDIVGWIASHFPTLISKKQDFNGDTALHIAAKAGSLQAAEMLLKDIGDSNSIDDQQRLLLRMKNNKGNIALHEALVNSQDEIAHYLIEKDPAEGAFYLNSKGESPLFLSAKAGCVKCVGLILSFREQLDKFIDQVKAGEAGKSPVHEAISSRKRGVLEFMLSEEPRLLCFTDEEGRLPLHYAACMGFVEEVKFILEKFAITSVEKDKNGFLPIHWASTSGEVKVVELLLQYSPHPKLLLDKKGRTILHFMAASGQFGALRYFLKNNQHIENLINIKDEEGNTPFHLAAMKSEFFTVGLMVFHPGVNVNMLNDEGMTALDVAQQLLTEGTSVNRLLTLELALFAIVRSVRGAYGNKKKKMVVVESGATPTPVDKNEEKEYKERANTLLIVATFVATITFAAGFTLPGGYNEKGMATLVDNKMFQTFILCDIIAMCCSIRAAVYLILVQATNWKDFRESIDMALLYIAFALGLMSLVFMAGVSVAVSHLKWLNYSILALGTSLCFITLGYFMLPHYHRILKRY